MAGKEYLQPQPEEKMQEYFPVRHDPRREISPEELEAADARWQAALERGRTHQQEILEQVEATLTTQDVAERLELTPDEVEQLRADNKLIGLRFFEQREYRYPAWQLTVTPEGKHMLLPHLDEVLAELEDATPWGKTRFLLSKSPALHNHTPLELLQSDKPDEINHVKQVTHNLFIR